MLSWFESGLGKFILLTTIFFVAIFIRYLFISGVVHYLFLVRFGKKFRERILNPSRDVNEQMRKEIAWSAYTSLIFAISGSGLLLLWENGYTAIYTDLHQYGILFLPFSLFLALFIQETYYYWMHRWMHRPGIYRIMHKVHHDSIHTSAMTSFSFHPLESIAQALILPFIFFLVPIHIYILGVFLLIMTISATINHAGIEVFPDQFHRHWLGKWLIGATHHDGHHKNFRCNYGLYFTFWDKWMGTESRNYKINIRSK
jgi:sterol desaturase/sphingolipid hydroxylase (fatty acid hydroxylase superfamily)